MFLIFNCGKILVTKSIILKRARLGRGKCFHIVLQPISRTFFFFFLSCKTKTPYCSAALLPPHFSFCPQSLATSILLSVFMNFDDSRYLV